MKISVVSAGILSLTVFGCAYGNARIVRETKNGGEIALEGMREPAQQKADAAMAAKCPGGYEVDEAGETVVGQSTDSQTQAKPVSLFSGPGTTTQSNSREMTEWRIKYHCKGTEAPAEKAAPGTEAPAQGTSGTQGIVQHTLIVRF